MCIAWRSVPRDLQLAGRRGMRRPQWPVDQIFSLKKDIICENATFVPWRQFGHCEDRMGKKTLLQSSQILESGCKKSHESWTYRKRLLVDIYDIFERGLSHVPSRTWDWRIESSSWLVCIPSGAYRWPWIRLGAIARCLNVGCIPKKLFHHSAIHREEHMAAVALGSSPPVPDRIYGNIAESRRV